MKLPISSLIGFILLFFCGTITFGQQTVAVDDLYLVDQPEWLPVEENDVNVPGNPYIVTQATHGTVVLQTGMLRYAPVGGYTGVDSFTYRYSVAVSPANPDGWSNTATVFLAVIGIDGATGAGVSCPIVGAPVNVTNGNMWLEQSDYKLPGIGETDRDRPFL